MKRKIGIVIDKNLKMEYILNMNDKNGQALEIGDRVIAFNSDTGQEFMARIEGIKQDTDGSLYAEVMDSDDDIYCVTSIDIEIDND